MNWNLWDFLQQEFKKISAPQEAAWVHKWLQNLDAAQARTRAEEILQRRQSGEPLAYIFGEWEFCERDFFVGPGVLIPRSETEELVQRALDFVSRQHQRTNKNPIRVADLGAGTGAIGISVALATTIPCHVTFVENSPEAAAYLRKNVARYLKDNFEIVEKDWKTLRDNFDLVLSNPPYVSAEEYALLDPSVTKFEPRLALVPEIDSLQPYRELIAFCEQGGGRAKKSGGPFRAFFEFGLAQVGKWSEILDGKGFSWVVHRDLSSKERILELFDSAHS